MTNEEMQNTIEFIIQWQEVFTEKLETMRQNQDRTQQQLDTLSNVVASIADQLAITVRVVDGLVDTVFKPNGGATNN